MSFDRLLDNLGSHKGTVTALILGILLKGQIDKVTTEREPSRGPASIEEVATKDFVHESAVAVNTKIDGVIATQVQLASDLRKISDRVYDLARTSRHASLACESDILHAVYRQR